MCTYGLLYLVASAIPVLRVQLRFVDCINKRKKKKKIRLQQTSENTARVEEFSRITAGDGDVLRYGTEQFDKPGQVLFVARVTMAGARAEQVLARRQLERLQQCRIRVCYTTVSSGISEC